MSLYPSRISFEAAFADSSETDLAVETWKPILETINTWSQARETTREDTHHKEDTEATYSGCNGDGHRDAKYCPQ